MRFKIVLLPLSFLFIVGTAEKCRDWDKYIIYEDGEDTKSICCSGYQNVSGKCEPLCIPSCVKGTCIHPNRCECIDGWYGDSCDLNSTGCFSVGNCECSPGYFGNKCLYSCPTNTYGLNCLQECQCEDCRKTDGYCKCQEGWKGTECTDYCPITFYDTSNNKCINRAEILSSNLLYSIIGMVIIAIVAVTIYLKRRKPRYDGMVNINAIKIIVPLPRAHIYEIIPNNGGYEIQTQLKPNIGRDPKTQPIFMRHSIKEK